MGYLSLLFCFELDARFDAGAKYSANYLIPCCLKHKNIFWHAS
ncbi:hypothetical protein SAMN05216311_107140 [Chitinophaga sp. CF418]|nr:hypothetical protein SAMN05216311_107140 [Chitinophaga sp. CF418]